MNSKSSLRAVLRSGLFKKFFGKVSWATKRESKEKFRAEVGEMMEKD